MQRLSLIIFHLFCFIGSTQNTNGVGNKGQLHFDIGMEYRITPVYNSSTSQLDVRAFLVNKDKQNSGPALNLGFEFFVFNNLSLGFVNSFRYDMVFSPTPDGEIDEVAVQKSEYGLLYDYHFKLAYYFKVSEKSKIFIDLGWSFLNRNSDFKAKEKLYDQNGENVGFDQYISSFEYGGSRFFLGYAKNKLKLQLGAYFSTTTPYFSQGNPNFIVPTIGITYNAYRF